MSRPQIVLCFDGTGNTFRADGTETNILKICRMLKRGDEQHVYYQPGIGTEITPGSLAATKLKRNTFSGRSKTLSQALGQTFDQHVLGGYRFLMRHYRESSEIFIFGFSRGAYTASYLADMLDYVGLLGPDNEEMVPLIWNAFSDFKMAGFKEGRGSAAFSYMKHCRRTLCRPIARIKFLGLFDAVNSVSGLELLTKGRSTAQTIRHAVSTDERRVKFQPVLHRSSARKNIKKRHAHINQPAAVPSESVNEAEDGSNEHVGGSPKASEETPSEDDETDIEELWFPGNHADIGGGFQRGTNEGKQLSHTPLVWMINCAEQAGLHVNHEEMCELGCKDEAGNEQSADSPYQKALLESATTGLLHSCLDFNSGVPALTVLGWKLMEYFPISRPKIMPDGSCRMALWPVHRSEPRDIPHDATVHGSVIKRMQSDDTYRPGNIIVGGGGRGIKTAPMEYGMGEWQLFKHEGDPLKEIYVRKSLLPTLAPAGEEDKGSDAL
ncbi:uncharacterized protein N7506_008968 [Penicillium brevicompactum]|uniref:uncharacterized protein n=1 Tax=Penicillium brevicompactum TaxID=5074 RepID=UPI002541F495|nr:uncharacterized protein N7506_008968 [Penicillium brevicompactum]KAJ5325866.1 hypothetical protein N7506_008968 [Penicillium brevicompactum]